MFDCLHDLGDPVGAARHVLEAVPQIRDLKVGVLHVVIQHTSASLTLNENASPDVRADFEDGYGTRPDEEEDGHAVSVAEEMAAGARDGTLPLSFGIRIKPLTDELRERSARLDTVEKEAENGDFGRTIARMLIFSTWRLALFEKLAASRDRVLSAVAVKGVKEIFEKSDPELAENPLIFPPADVLSNLHIFKGLAEDEESTWNDKFSEVTGN